MYLRSDFILVVTAILNAGSDILARGPATPCKRNKHLRMIYQTGLLV